MSSIGTNQRYRSQTSQGGANVHSFPHFRNKSSTHRKNDLRHILQNSQRKSPDIEVRSTAENNRRERNNDSSYNVMRNHGESGRSVELIPRREVVCYDDLDSLVDQNESSCLIDSNTEKAPLRGRQYDFEKYEDQSKRKDYSRNDEQFQHVSMIRRDSNGIGRLPLDGKPIRNDEQFQHINKSGQESRDGFKTTEQLPWYELNGSPVRNAGHFFTDSKGKQTKSPPQRREYDFIPLSPISDRSLSPKQINIEDLVGNLVNFISKHGNRVSLDHLENSNDQVFQDIKHFSNNTRVEDFVNRYKHIFSITESINYNEDGEIDTFVSHNLTLQLCEKHCHKAGSCNGSCRMLHICRFYVMGSCENCNDAHCRYDHTIFNNHNDQVLVANSAHRMDEEQIIHEILLHRNALTLPQICTFYNAKGCIHDHKCPFLHICKHFITENCKFPFCMRSHTFVDQQPSAILRKYRLDYFLENAEKLLLLLKMLTPMVHDQYDKYAEKKKATEMYGHPNNAISKDKREGPIHFQTSVPSNIEWTMLPHKQTSSIPVEQNVVMDIERKYKMYLQSKEQIFRINGEE